MPAQNILDFVLELASFFIVRKFHPYALGPVACSAGGRDPGNFARHGVAHGVVWQGHEDINIVAELVLFVRRDKNAAIRKLRDVGRVQRGFFFDGQLNHARPGHFGCTVVAQGGAARHGGHQRHGRGRHGGGGDLGAHGVHYA